MNSEYQGVGRTKGPHIRENWTSKWIMQQVIIALLFPTIASFYFFGLHSLLLIMISVFCCLLLEIIYQKIIKIEVSVDDFTAVITGWLLALSLPVNTPIWILFIGDFVAIIVIKQLQGGTGLNLLNPAVTARVILKLFFSPWITNWTKPLPEAVSTATPLSELGHFSRQISDNIPELWKLFLGIGLGGPIGETCKLAIFLSFIYLVMKKIIHIQVPIICLSSFYLVIFLYSGFNFSFSNAHLFSGSLILASVFMVTDYTTTPLTDLGKYIFAIGCGIICAILRITTELPGGIGIAIIIMNLLTPLINKHTLPVI
ncbi:RnfABCDGE type electron transport complex subunit D, partial [Enterococcus faecalis]|nr:RnfABCDGE type electron transport complex subunit D [Enterococcus faecalis]